MCLFHYLCCSMQRIDVMWRHNITISTANVFGQTHNNFAFFPIYQIHIYWDTFVCKKISKQCNRIKERQENEIRRLAGRAKLTEIECTDGIFFCWRWLSDCHWIIIMFCKSEKSADKWCYYLKRLHLDDSEILWTLRCTHLTVKLCGRGQPNIRTLSTTHGYTHCIVNLVIIDDWFVLHIRWHYRV